jgi:hypothetical protein
MGSVNDEVVDYIKQVQDKFFIWKDNITINQKVALGSILIIYLSSLSSQPKFYIKEIKKLRKKRYSNLKEKARTLNLNGQTPVICRLKDGHGEFMFLLVLHCSMLCFPNCSLHSHVVPTCSSH